MSQIRVQKIPDTIQHQSRNSTLNLQFQDDRGRDHTRKSQPRSSTLREFTSIDTRGSQSRDFTRHRLRSVSEHVKLKNIPESNVRPQVKKWNSFQGDIDDSNNVFSILKDEYNTKQLAKYYSWNSQNLPNSSTDNLFKTLQQPENKMTPKENTGLYEKMSKLIIHAQNSMNSLVNSFKTENQVESESESSDSELEEEVVNPDTQYTIESWKSPPSVQPVNIDDFHEIINEINQFHGNFVTKNLTQPNQIKLNRTQQRLLDYKQLYGDEKEEKNPLGLSSYELKIQNETILSQYTSIRLRFSSHEIETSSKKQVITYMGVQGFINRVKNFNLPYTKDSNITFENKDTILKKIWDDEYNSYFTSKLLNNDIESENSEIGIYNSDNVVNMSNLAKSVKLRH